MGIRKLWRAASATATVGLLTLATPDGVQAQLQPVVFGTAEADTQDQSVLLIGASVQPARTGLVPTAGILAYRVTFPVAENTTTSLSAVVPSVGLRYQTPVSGVQLSVGYVLLSEEGAGGFGAPGGTRQGVSTTLMGDYWGSGERSAQGILSFNWADRYLWSRVRGTQRVAGLGTEGGVNLGAEVVAQGGGAEGEEYRALQAGPVVEVQLSPAVRLLGSVGAKTDNLEIPDRPEVFPYFKFEFVLVP